MPEWIVTQQESGQKLAAFLSHRLDQKYSAKHLKRIVEHNGCKINGKTQRFAATILGTGDRVSLDLALFPLPSPKSAEPARILFEDEALLVYDKPPGINCDEGGILALLKPHAGPLHLIHRLDRETTGVIVFAKTQVAFEDIVEQFKQRQIEKSYIAIVDGVLDKSEGIVENYLHKKQSFAGQTLWGATKGEKGLYAKTEWVRIKKGLDASWVACFPVTGRTHQIRVHMSEMGHPLLGDHQYGKDFQCTYRPPRILLHAEQIRFKHPVTEKLLHIQAPVPEDFKQAQQKLFKG